MNIGSCRGYFQLKGLNAADVAKSRIVLNFGDDESTGIVNVNRETITNNRYYDLQGRKLSNGKSSNGQMPRGLYIYNGKKVVIK